VNTKSAADTIAAIATAPGAAAVGILRVSGPRSLALAQVLFHSSRPNFTGFKNHRLHHGTLRSPSGELLDEVLCSFMPGPGSYTGEDSVEFQCHGGTAVLRCVLDELLALGARLARPGEFTLRAFLHGKLDLTQAEAVAECINAPTRAALHLAQLKLSGTLGNRINSLRERLERLRALLCLAVDFPDEDVECLPLATLHEESLGVAEEVALLLAGVERAKVWREGVMAVLAGRVNAGKSSLLNALTGRKRALVSPLPGTTRDYIEEPIDLNGLLVRLVDTAGLRELPQGTPDTVEHEGQEAGRELMARAEAVLYVLDSSAPLTPEDVSELVALGEERTIVVLNKCDLVAAEPTRLAALSDAPPTRGFAHLPVSARTGEGLDTLCTLLRQRLLAHSGVAPVESDPDAAAPNTRQAVILAAARKELLALAQDAASAMPYDILGVRLQTACTLLAEITGEVTPDAVLKNIFEQFCIGK